MRKNIVLIDFESVQPDSIAALDHEHFRVIVFCGANQSKVPFEIATSLQRLGSRAQYVKITGSGPNALDFHIAYYMGRMTAEDPNVFFHIVSRDKGFDPLIKHMKSLKRFAMRSEAIADIPAVKNAMKRPPNERAEAFIARLKESKVSRPGTEKRLSAALKSCFKPGVDDAEAAEIIKAMAAAGYIAIEAGKVVYL